MQSYSSTIRPLYTNGSARGRAFSFNVVESCPGRKLIRISGNDAKRRMTPEAGGHRWQRIPPTEKNGRRQSSTVTVAIIGENRERIEFNERDVEFRYCVASVGAGGQNRQKNETACVAIHRPTGLEAKCQDERSQKRNRQKALAVLRQRVIASHTDKANAATNEDRRGQIGCGERGDKIRTVQMHNGLVTNHRTGRKVSVDKYLKGYIEDVQ